MQTGIARAGLGGGKGAGACTVGGAIADMARFRVWVVFGTALLVSLVTIAFGRVFEVFEFLDPC